MGFTEWSNHSTYSSVSILSLDFGSSITNKTKGFAIVWFSITSTAGEALAIWVCANCVFSSSAQLMAPRGGWYEAAAMLYRQGHVQRAMPDTAESKWAVWDQIRENIRTLDRSLCQTQAATQPRRIVVSAKYRDLLKVGYSGPPPVLKSCLCCIRGCPLDRK